MLTVLNNSWALLLGMLLLMIGNGLQGTLLGVRGALEGFDTNTMSWIMAAYFVGFLGGSRITPRLIRRVGHVRVFAALGSLVSAAFILYAAFADPIAWAVMRLLVGFCFSGLYVVAESWLNDSATNETRGQALSAYVIMQMLGIVTAQVLVNFGDPGGYVLFVVMSVLVSISFAPILLSVSPAPVFQTTKPMGLRDLFRASPLGFIGTFFMGAIFSALFGMAPVFGTEKGLSVAEISIFVALIYVGGLVAQFPIGWLSDRMDRRRLIFGVTAGGAVAIVGAMLLPSSFAVLSFAAVLIGAVSNPLYSLLLAYTNDFLDHDGMAAAAGQLMFVNGCGAIIGPFIVGWAMSSFGADSYFWFIAAMLGAVAIYALYRMTQRAAPTSDETSTYAAVLPTASPVLVEVAQEVAIEMADEASDEGEMPQDGSDPSHQELTRLKG
ncbi:MAG: MFS transporter [Pseudomonadota bacterium]